MSVANICGIFSFYQLSHGYFDLVWNILFNWYIHNHVITATVRSWRNLWQKKTIINTLRPRQNGYYLADSIFRCFFLNENVWISINISLKFVAEVQIKNILALVQIMAWHLPGDKPLSEPMMASLLMHISVPLPQWVNVSFLGKNRMRHHE